MRSASLWAFALVAPAAAQASLLPPGYQGEVALDESPSAAVFRGFVVAGNGLLYAAVQNQIVEIDALGNRSVVLQLPSGTPGVIGAPGNGANLYVTDVTSTA